MRQIAHLLCACLGFILLAGGRVLAGSPTAYDELMGGGRMYVLDREDSVLEYRAFKPGETIKHNTTLRILPAGDSLTVGYLSDQDGGNGDGYRRQLAEDLSGNEVVFAGTGTSGTMEDGYYAAWSGRTIQYISRHIGPSLKQNPNIILLMAGTNDMNPNPDISQQGTDPIEAAKRLGELVDKIIDKCPEAVILVAIVIPSCRDIQSESIAQYQKLIPGVVRERRDKGHRVLAADFSSFSVRNLRDCIHPTNEGYKILGNYWYSFIHQIPPAWIEEPIGPNPDPERESGGGRHRPIFYLDFFGYLMIVCIWILS